MNAEKLSTLMPITSRPEPIMVRGEGSYLFDGRGRRYLDFIQSWAVNALGHCPPEIQKALADEQNLLLILDEVQTDVGQTFARCSPPRAMSFRYRLY